eukprot:4696501-Prymnesium_polylepis.2
MRHSFSSLPSHIGGASGNGSSSSSSMSSRSGPDAVRCRLRPTSSSSSVDESPCPSSFRTLVDSLPLLAGSCGASSRGCLQPMQSSRPQYHNLPFGTSVRGGLQQERWNAPPQLPSQNMIKSSSACH